MCKEPDHVSFPSAQGMARAATTSGLTAERIWSTELPFEFPVSALVSARDWKRERLSPSGGSANHAGSADSEGATGLATKSRLARLYSKGARIDPTSRLLGALGRAATVKARLRPSKRQGQN